MRPEVLLAWRRKIEKEVSRALPEFKPVTKRVRGEPRGMLKYQWHPQRDLWCYIAFRPLDSEALDALIGWSVTDRFPIGETPHHTPQDLEDFSAPYVLDWSSSFVPRSGAAHWNFWNPSTEAIESPKVFAEEYGAHFARSLSPEEADELVAPSVDLAIAEVRTHGLPYLRRRAAYKEG